MSSKILTLLFRRRLIFSGLLMLLTFTLLSVGRVYANHGFVSPTPIDPMPQYISDYLLACHAGGPSVAGWLARAGDPTILSFEVNYGTPSVSLEMHDNGAGCINTAGTRVTHHSSIIDSAGPAGVSGIAGTTAIMSYPCAGVQGCYTHSSRVFTYSPPGGFIQSATHTISVTGRFINRFQRADGSEFFRCVPSGVATTALDNFAPCGQESLSVNIEIRVKPSITIDGASNCDLIFGFAEDVDSPNTALRIQLFRDGAFVAETFANAATNRYDFDISSFADGVAHTYIVRALGVGTNGFEDGNNADANPNYSPGTCVEPSCGSLQFEPTGPPGAGQRFNINVNFLLSASAIVDYSVTFNRGGLTYGGTNPIRGLVNGNSILVTFRDVTAPSAGEYTGTFVLTGNMPSGPLPTITCEFGDANGNGVFEWEDPIAAVERPYYRIYGGDAAVGTAFEDLNGVCDPNLDSPRFIGFNAGFPDGITNGFAGAGSQLASMALGEITEHATGVLRTAIPFTPNGLSLSNSSVAGTYGGLLGSSHVADCAPNYFLSRTGTDPGSTLNINPGVSGDYNRPPGFDLTLTTAAPGMGDGRTVTVYVEGNVYINENITYANAGSFDDPADIPRFMLVVLGNIYVHPSVTELSGLYIAQPELDGSGIPVSNTGLFVTCGFTGATHADRLPNNTQLNQSAPAGCRNKLTVTGAVIANGVKTLRTQGNLVNEEELPNPRLRLAFSHMGPGSLSTNPTCTNINEPADPNTGVWVDNFLCGTSDANDLQLTFSYGALPIFVPEPGYPSAANIRNRSIGGRWCTLISEIAEPDPPTTAYIDSGMFNNYVCVNPAYGPGGAYGDRGWSFVTSNPSQAAEIAGGKTCIRFYEPADPNTWEDNYLCYYDEAQFGRPGISEPPTLPPATRQSPAEGRGSPNIAEVFIYSPEVWLRGLPGQGGLNSFTSLPPVL